MGYLDGSVFFFFSVTWPIWISLILTRLSFGSLRLPEKLIRPDFIVNRSLNSHKEELKTDLQKQKKAVVTLPYDELRKDNQPHVLDAFQDLVQGKVDTALQNLFTKDGEIVTVAGLVCRVAVFKTQIKNEAMATGVIEDPSGRAEITLYPQTWLAHPLDENDIVLLSGRVKTGKILVNSLEKIGEVPFI